jgi:hypothetical protein
MVVSVDLHPQARERVVCAVNRLEKERSDRIEILGFRRQPRKRQHQALNVPLGGFGLFLETDHDVSNRPHRVPVFVIGGEHKRLQTDGVPRVAQVLPLRFGEFQRVVTRLEITEIPRSLHVVNVDRVK